MSKYRVVHDSVARIAFDVTEADRAQFSPEPRPCRACGHCEIDLTDEEVAGMIMLQQRTRRIGAQGRVRYRMNERAMAAADHCLIATRIHPDMWTDGCVTRLGEAVLTFRGVPVMRDDNAPWIDIEIEPPPINVWPEDGQ